MKGHKHYIRVREDNTIIHIFSNAFEQPEGGDICVNEDGDRHFHQINGEELFDKKGFFQFKYEEEQIKKKSVTEINQSAEYVLAESAKLLADLMATDVGMARVTEDLFEFVVNSVPIPQDAIDKIANRKVLRSKLT